MIVDGKEIRDQIQEKLVQEVRARAVLPELCIFTVGSDSVTETFVNVKRKFAQKIGIPLRERKFQSNSTEAEILRYIEADAKKGNRGIVIQLPLPKHFDRQKVLDAVPITHDVDVLSTEAMKAFENDTLSILPPVVGAIKEILLRHNIFVGNKNVVIVGRGKLVGKPAAVWFQRHQSNVHIIDTKTKDSEKLLRDADIIVVGAGVPHFIKPSMIKDGVVILDAGTSEVHGKVAGDADPLCAERASIFTPVPGGIGPITVAILFKNLLDLTA